MRISWSRDPQGFQHSSSNSSADRTSLVTANGTGKAVVLLAGADVSSFLDPAFDIAPVKGFATIAKSFAAG